MTPRTRFELDRFEVWTLLGIMVLFSGLVFTFGIMVGMGMRPASPLVAEVAHGEEHGGRAPASVDAKPATVAPIAEAGADLKAAYAEAKQEALRELVMQEGQSTDPKSVADAAAHFGANPGWAGEASPKPPEVKAEDARIARAEAAEANRLEKGPEKSVRSLFERKPAARDVFTPISNQFTVRVQSFATAEEATAKVGALRKLGFNDAYMRPIKSGDGAPWFQVSVGSFVQEVWAMREGERLLQTKASRDFKVEKVK